MNTVYFEASSPLISSIVLNNFHYWLPHKQPEGCLQITQKGAALKAGPKGVTVGCST